MFGKPVSGDRHPQRMVLESAVVRKPHWNMPVWLWLLKQIVWGVVAVLGWALRKYFRFWWVTIPATVVGFGFWRFGWELTTPAVLTVAGLLAVWWWKHPASFWSWLGWFYLAQWRRWFVYRKPWHPTCANLGLAIAFDGDRFYPAIVKVRRDAEGDLLTVCMLNGQHPNDYAKHASRFAYTFNVLSCTIRSDMKGRKRNQLILHMRVHDSLATVVAPFPVPAIPNLGALPVADRAGGKKVTISLVTHVLIAGASGAGKGSALWSIIAALAPGVRDGTIRLYGFDPKGGVELVNGEPLFYRFFFDDPSSMADAFEELVTAMKRRQESLRRRGLRTHIATPGDPTIVIVIDEFGALTAYVGDKKIKDRINLAMALLLSQGRAVGVHVVAASQDTRKEILPFRGLFTTRIALRLNEESEVAMILDDDAVDRGAACHEIPKSMPGVGYLVLEGEPQPVRLRFPYHTDTDLRQLGQQYRPAIPATDHQARPGGPVDELAPSDGPAYEVNR